MLRLSLIDANEKANREYAGMTSSVVSGWLLWEASRAGLSFVHPKDADIILLVYAGALDWLAECKSYLRKNGIMIDARERNRHPYIITGGPVDAIPFTALSIADALAVGEAYNFTRKLFDLVKSGANISDIALFVEQYPHAIERKQIDMLSRDNARPWMLSNPAPVLASPDQYIDWGIPPVRSDDKVIRIIAEKGCHCKCAFCATTYRQTHRQNENEGMVIGQLNALKSRGERVQLVSNDPMALPYFNRINTKLDSQSFTITEISNDANRATIIRNGVGIARFGVEGISERIRKAFAKPINNTHLLDILAELHGYKINTHMFFIVGAPGESKQDWEEFRLFYDQLAKTIKNGICRIKFTTFVNTPPAPLARFVPSLSYEKAFGDFRVWISGNAASRHLLYVRGRGGKSHIENIAEQLSITTATAKIMTDNSDTFDLCPTIEDARKMLWEVIDWPIPLDVRYRISDIYRRRIITGNSV